MANYFFHFALSRRAMYIAAFALLIAMVAGYFYFETEEAKNKARNGFYERTLKSVFDFDVFCVPCPSFFGHQAIGYVRKP